MPETVEVYFQDEKRGEVSFTGEQPVLSGDRSESLRPLLESCRNRLGGKPMTAEVFIRSLHGHWWGQTKSEK